MILYSATFAAIAVAAAQDLFEILAPKNKSVRIVEFAVGQYSDFGDAAAEILSILFLRGYTTAGSGGAAVTPRPFNRYLPAANSTVARNNTTVAADGTAHTLIADAFNIRNGWHWKAPPLDMSQFEYKLPTSPYAGLAARMPDQIILGPSERAVLRITLPADAITANGTLLFQEL